VIVRIAADSAVPPYAQLRSQVAAMIASGQLEVGYRLPPIRQLAADLDLAPGTVARAYRELEAAGLIVTEGRRGTRVSAPGESDPSVVTDQLDDAARSFATTVRQLGIDPQTALSAIRRALGTALPT
jgi:DNA-binding transcriptional regulator YhcF (GntR family)